MSKLFSLIYKSSKSRARRGIITTSHGVIQTPAFVPVGTKGTIKSLTPTQTHTLGIQLAFVNTYHLAIHPGTDIINNVGGVHKYSQLPFPLMSDSGGFQVFSLANKRQAHLRGGEEDPLLVKINPDGVVFRSVYDGSTIEFTPKTSMLFQTHIGADLIMAFDECTPQGMDLTYARTSMERTHEWLKQSIHYKKEYEPLAHHQQFLYGIIQGAGYEKLRKESAEFVTGMNTPGIAIGGVAVGEGKEEIRNQVAWVSSFLPQDRPVHLLGVGFIEDIVDLVKHGIDTFDCVEPTRMAREGRLLCLKQVLQQIEQPSSPNDYVLDITKNTYKYDTSKVDEEALDSSIAPFTKSYVHHLFKQKELLAYNLATQHNLHVMEAFMKSIRDNIEKGNI